MGLVDLILGVSDPLIDALLAVNGLDLGEGKLPDVLTDGVFVPVLVIIVSASRCIYQPMHPAAFYC